MTGIAADMEVAGYNSGMVNSETMQCIGDALHEMYFEMSYEISERYVGSRKSRKFQDYLRKTYFETLQGICECFDVPRKSQMAQ